MNDEYREKLIKHALGWPKMYRNHYCTSDGGLDEIEWAGMERDGIAEKIKGSLIIPGSTFRVTKAGKDWLEKRCSRPKSEDVVRQMRSEWRD